MSILLKNVTVHGILLDAVFDGDVEERARLHKLLTEGLKKGEVKPLPVTSYSWDAAEEAFRFVNLRLFCNSRVKGDFINVSCFY